MSIVDRPKGLDAPPSQRTSGRLDNRRDYPTLSKSTVDDALASETGAEAPLAPAWRRHRGKLAVAAQYLFAVAITLAIIARLMNLSQADFHMPFAYGGDALMFQTWCDALVQHGWYLHNPLLGAPQTQSMEDFPQVDSLHFLIIKFFALFTHDTQIILNLFCLMTYVLPVLTSLFVLRRLGVAYPVALACGLLYSFLPYHFIRLGGHYCLTCYYVVPLSILLAIRLYQGRFSGDTTPDEPGAAKPTLSPRAQWACAGAICLLQASAGVYYAFFAMYFQSIAGVSAALQRRRFQPLFVAATLVAITMGGILANLAPTLLYWHRHGSNPECAHRLPSETEFYSFKLAAMILPIPGHRVDAIRDFRGGYENISRLSNENMWSAQGTVANLGFITLLGLLLYRNPVPKLLEGLSVLNLFGILFATTGGLGMIFSLLVTPQFRSQNRVSVFLSFYSLACVAFVLSFIWRRFGASRIMQCVMSGGLVGLVLLALWDQHPKGTRPPYDLVRSLWTNDVDFVGNIEKAMPPGAMIYQVPYARYPEMPPVVNFTGSDGIRFSLHSKTLRWSIGAVKGRETDRWLMQLSALPIDQQLQAAADAGFQGIQVNRKGYVDNGAEVEVNLRRLLGEPIVSPSGGELFFSMIPYDAVRAGSVTQR